MGAILLKTWRFQGNKKISLFLEQTQLTAKVYSATEREENNIPHWDIDIPREIQRDLISLVMFLQDTYIRLVPYHDNSYKLYVHHRLRGGGFFDFIFSLTQVSLGIALGDGSAAYLALSSGLITAGVNGAVQALQTEENFAKPYIRRSLAGFTSGVIMGGTTSLVDYSTVTTQAKISAALIRAGGSAAAQVSSDLISDAKVDVNKICLSAATACGVTLASARATNKLLESSKITLSSYHGTEVGMNFWRAWKAKKTTGKNQIKEFKQVSKDQQQLDAKLTEAGEESTASQIALNTVNQELEAILKKQELELAELQREQLALYAALGETPASAATQPFEQKREHLAVEQKPGALLTSTTVEGAVSSTFSTVPAKPTIKQLTKKIERNNQDIQEVLTEHELLLKFTQQNLAASREIISEHQATSQNPGQRRK